MSATTDVQHLITLSLGKIALSRQQRGGINLHKNLLVASVLHKARTTYMMNNFQTLLANKRGQAEREAAAKRIVENPVEVSGNKRDIESMDETRGVTDSSALNTTGVLNGECSNNDRLDKENIKPAINNDKSLETDCCNNDGDDEVFEGTDKKSCRFENVNYIPAATRKLTLSAQGVNSNDVSQVLSGRCALGKRSFVDSDSVTDSKKARFEHDSKNNESVFGNDRDLKESAEQMQTESQVTGLVENFSSGFNGLLKDSVSVKAEKQTTGQIYVYVCADLSVSINGHHQYALKDLKCGTQVKDGVTLPMATAIALAV